MNISVSPTRGVNKYSQPSLIVTGPLPSSTVKLPLPIAVTTALCNSTSTPSMASPIPPVVVS